MQTLKIVKERRNSIIKLLSNPNTKLFKKIQMESSDLLEEDRQVICDWIDEIPLSRLKKSITRDFSDGVLIALSSILYPKS